MESPTPSMTMIHLITVLGRSAKRLYLDKDYISDFKSLLRSLTSGRVLLVSTPFRSDLLYKAKKNQNEAILKLWTLYAGSEMFELNVQDFKYYRGAKNCLTNYFQSIHSLSTHWYHYKQYKQALLANFVNDHQNPLAKTILDCDRFLVRDKGAKRSPLVQNGTVNQSILTKDHFSLAMRLMHNDTHIN